MCTSLMAQVKGVSSPPSVPWPGMESPPDDSPPPSVPPSPNSDICVDEPSISTLFEVHPSDIPDAGNGLRTRESVTIETGTILDVAFDKIIETQHMDDVARETALSRLEAKGYYLTDLGAPVASARRSSFKEKSSNGWRCSRWGTCNAPNMYTASCILPHASCLS